MPKTHDPIRVCPRSLRACTAAALAIVAAATCARSTAVAAELRPRVVKTRYATGDVVIACMELRSPGERIDASPALQGAIDRVAGIGGGVIFLAPGRYRLEKPILLKEGVTLRGDRPAPSREGGVEGTVLMPVADRGNEDGSPAITVERGTGITHLSVWYPEQDAERIVPYPWTIAFALAENAGDNMTVRDVTLVNPYKGVAVGPNANELHTIQRVVGTPLKLGIAIDSVYDIGRLTDVEFAATCWERSGLPGAPRAGRAREALKRHLIERGTGIEMGRSDWEYVYRLRVDGYAVGCEFRSGQKGATNAVMYGSELTGCGTALLLREMNRTGLAATGCRFEGSDACVKAPRSFTGVANFNACDFGGGASAAVVLEGEGFLGFQGCRLGPWREAGVRASRGSVSLLDCDLDGASRHVVAGAEVRRVRVLSCRFAGEPDVACTAETADVQIGHTPLRFEKPDTSPHVESRMPRPARDELFVVTDHGASIRAADNTRAFARALEAAGAAGGGTVYVPAGIWRVKRELVVPSGCELRGIFDVPHHTQSAGSVIVVTAGRGEPDGTPFVRLERGSGLRGLTFWYPEQLSDVPVPYPWTVRALGPRCWLVDVTLGNAWLGVDLWTNESTGHVVRYLAGCVYRKALWISKSNGDGWVEDVQLNPHYSERLHRSLAPYRTKRKTPGRGSELKFEHLRTKLQAVVFGRCEREHVRGTFVFAAGEGIAFRDDRGGANARVIMHGSDTGERGAVISRVGPRGVEFVNAQLVPVAKQAKAAIVVEPTFRGRVRFFNTQVWGQGQVPACVAEGRGDLLLQQLNNRCGRAELRSGKATLENAYFHRDAQPSVTVGRGFEKARVLACVGAAGALAVHNQAASRAFIRSSACSLRLRPRRSEAASRARALRLDFEDGPRVAAKPLGVQNVAGAECAVVQDPDGKRGARSLRIAGRATAGHSIAYYAILARRVPVFPNTEVSFRMKPTTRLGRQTSVDVLFDGGKPMRDRGVKTSAGVSTHPGTGRGEVGKWTRVTVPLGRQVEGVTIATVVVAFDSGDDGEFEAYYDDIRIESAAASGALAEVKIAPEAVRISPGARVTLSVEGGARIRYTTDGTNPTLDSPVYALPLRPARTGLWEVRCVTDSDGVLGRLVRGRLYDVR